MTLEKAGSKRLTKLLTEDWLAVVVGLVLVVLVLAGVLKNVP